MSDSDELNLYLRKKNGSEECDEDWDDTELVVAYDKAISNVKRRLTRKIQRELGLNDEDVQEFLSDAESSSSKSKKFKEKKSRKIKWIVGSSCRAVYSEDGEDYEAVIVKMIDKHWCLVRFVGYENEEEVLLKDLSPSLGKDVVQAQIEGANKEGEELSEDGEIHDEDGEIHDEEGEIHDETPEHHAGHRFLTEKFPRHKRHITNYEPTIKRLPMSFPVPFPPPAPPSMMTKDQTIKQADINSLLMSWYMCGYYTGLYERGTV